MLTGLGYKNFKCFKTNVDIPVKQINLLTGINGRGKSTTIQGLLLMRQSPEHSRTTDQIVFNGSCVDLGTFDDVRNSDVSRSEAVELCFTFSNKSGIYHLRYVTRENIDDDMVAQIEKVEVFGEHLGQPFQVNIHPKPEDHVIIYNNNSYPLYWKNLLFERMEDKGDLFLDILQAVDFTKIHYVSADRIGPRDYYAKQTFTEFPNVGRKGEYTANMLLKKGQDSVHWQLCLASSATNTVIDQSEAWLAKIFDGGKINITPTGANMVILSMNSESSSRTYKPTNIGFGYSYALPIIVSGLIARPGEILVIENPEAHLHPFAQSQLARFLALVSSTGVQVCIESHSDHILNGLRVSIVDQIIGNNNLNVLYYRREAGNNILQIAVEEDGSIEEWPDGFFDQMNKDFSRLFGV
jgi:predicted ATPase